MRPHCFSWPVIYHMANIRILRYTTYRIQNLHLGSTTKKNSFVVATTTTATRKGGFSFLLLLFNIKEKQHYIFIYIFRASGTRINTGFANKIFYIYDVKRHIYDVRRPKFPTFMTRIFHIHNVKFATNMTRNPHIYDVKTVKFPTFMTSK